MELQSSHSRCARVVIVPVVIAALVTSCEPSPTQGNARDVVGIETIRSGRQLSYAFDLVPPSGSPFPEAAGRAKIDGQFLDGTHPVFGPAQGLRLEVSGLPCRCYVGGGEAREFYTVFVSTTSVPSVRVLTFNTSFLSNIGSELVMPVPLNMPLFTEGVIVQVYLESDDGLNGSDGAGMLVLRGQITPN